MALKVELRPGEKLLVGNCIITNADQRTRLFIDGQAPILREKDILTADTADTPAKRIYLAVQLMYINDDVDEMRDEYFALVNEFVTAVPSSMQIVDQINNEILTGQLYKALKASQRLREYEQELLAHVSTGRSGIPRDGENR
ncbi:putative flagellum biosynthesis repressor protein FlbT 1 [Devosia pacifica]|uniref:Flagellum biosynthesis repressor protein FlbT 1 n=1 Tax=Devosia pacifica TaxID=1335967 RepID=A0A918RXI1_9HYPH|nr:flagellar biosynthesis repressor FlbT [Devosia pacifica]GHA14781.1 putative flagellum biosynthesis repressor protein FlbT 1 [Devosia pacifica]